MKFNKAAIFGLCRALRKESGRLFLASRHSADSIETRGSFKITRAAMFGLCRALKKEPGRLFLASRHSAVSIETRGSFKTTRAAMFGLDARIALAIFGALSVISGAALYSAIQTAKVTAIMTELNEIGKAIESYFLDTGELPERMSTDKSSAQHYRIKTAPLIIDSGIMGWKGPYINSAISGDFLSYPKVENGLIYAYLLESNGTLGGSHDYGDALCNAANKVCAIWVSLWGFKTDSALQQLDRSFDSDNGDDVGNIRWTTTGSGASLRYRLLYKYMPSN